jgi:hypothetical protein
MAGEYRGLSIEKNFRDLEIELSKCFELKTKIINDLEKFGKADHLEKKIHANKTQMNLCCGMVLCIVEGIKDRLRNDGVLKDAKNIY